MAVAAALLLSTLSAYAQTVPEVDAQLYRVPVDAARTLWTDDAATAPDGYWLAKLGLNYMHDPLVYRYADGEEVKILSSGMQANLIGAVNYGDVRIGLDVPIWLVARGDIDESNGGGLGDLALDVKGTLLDPEDAPIGFALGGRVSLPTATSDMPVGSPGLGWSVQAIADKHFGPLVVAANLGTQGVPPSDLDGVEWNDQFFYRLGAGYALTAEEDIGVSADLAGRLTYRDLEGAGAPLEGLLGGWYRLQDTWVMRGGLGTGLTRGIGAPDFRAVFTIGYEPPKVSDADGDGVMNRDDACRDEPEDVDGWMDADGCPDPTTIVNIEVLDADSKLIEVATTTVGTQADDATGGGELTVELHPGSWPLKVAADRYAAHSETIVVPEGETFNVVVTLEPLFGRVHVVVTDLEGEPIDATVHVGEGEPKAAAAGDTTFEADAGEMSLMIRADGYSPRRTPVAVKAGAVAEIAVKLAPARAKVTKDKIEILDKVFFDTGKATIQEASFALLNDVAAILDGHRDIKQVRIEGHTDGRGGARANLTLSQARAESVKTYLVGKGIAEGRLEAVGYGEDKPVAKGSGEEAWDKNRRVEFTVLKRSL